MAEDLIDRIAGGYRGAQVLFAGCQLGVFARIGDDTRTAEELSASLDADLRGVRILLDALVGLGLLERSQLGYTNSAAVRNALVPGAPLDRTAHVLHAASQCRRWQGLVEAVRSGRPVPLDNPAPPPAAKEAFAQAMAVSARRSAELTANAIDLTGVRRMLDVGGGPGVFAAAFARRQPGLEVTVLDDPDTLRVTVQTARSMGLQNRIHSLPGDAFHADLGGPWDLILLSNVVHIYSASQNRDLVGRLGRTLNPGGRLVLKDFFVSEERTEPAWSLLFAVNMLVSTDHGDCYRLSEALEWLDTAGLEWIQTVPVTEQSLLVIGRRPNPAGIPPPNPLPLDGPDSR